MDTNPVVTFIESTPEGSRIRRKVGKAVKRLRRIKKVDLEHAKSDLKHARKDLTGATLAFEHLVQTFEQAVADFIEAEGNPASVLEDHTHADKAFDDAEELLLHAVKDFRHAVKDFSHALKDLEQIEEIAEQIAEAATAQGHKGITPELVRLYVTLQSETA